MSCDCCKEVGGALATPWKMHFVGSSASFSLAIEEAGLPVDWSDYHFLVLELTASSSQRFELAIQTQEGTPTMRIHPFENVAIRAAVPLTFFRDQPRTGHDHAAVGNKQRGTFYAGAMRNQGPLKTVASIVVAMIDPVGSPCLEIRSIKLMRDDPGDAVLGQTPVVDAFGQWIPADWPGKVRDLADLQARWQADEAALQPGDYGLGRFGGYADTQVQATGFFRVEQVEGRWWFVDPEGHLFFSTGTDVMRTWMGTNVQGREDVFAELPPADLAQSQLDEAGPQSASFHTWNLLRRFGPDWPQRWAEMTMRRMDAWGVNTVACWANPILGAQQKKAYTVWLTDLGIQTGPMGLPDSHDAGYAQHIDEVIEQQCAPHRDDPWLLGYFVGNEQPWPGREVFVTQMVQEGPDTAMKRALATHLAQGDTPERRIAFIRQTFMRAMEIVCEAIHRYDPNHLNLGIRFAGHTDDEITRMSKIFDVFSYNCYQYAPKQEELARLYALTGLPIVVGEFHIGTPGRGMASGLVQAKDQTERGVAYQYYVEQAASHPAMIGTHWFEWWDQPNTGRNDGEDYNIGFVDVTDLPHEAFLQGVMACHKRVHAVHSGQVAPSERHPKAH